MNQASFILLFNFLVSLSNTLVFVLANSQGSQSLFISGSFSSCFLLLLRRERCLQSARKLRNERRVKRRLLGNRHREDRTEMIIPYFMSDVHHMTSHVQPSVHFVIRTSLSHLIPHHLLIRESWNQVRHAMCAVREVFAILRS